MPDLSKFIRKRVQKEGIDITIEVLEKVTTFIGAGMGLVVALAWNTAIKTLFDKFFSQQPTANIMAQFTYAIFVTMLVVIMTIYLGRVFKIVKSIKEESQEIPKEEK